MTDYCKSSKLRRHEYSRASRFPPRWVFPRREPLVEHRPWYRPHVPADFRHGRRCDRRRIRVFELDGPHAVQRGRVCPVRPRRAARRPPRRFVGPPRHDDHFFHWHRGRRAAGFADAERLATGGCADAARCLRRDLPSGGHPDAGAERFQSGGRDRHQWTRGKSRDRGCRACDRLADQVDRLARRVCDTRSYHSRVRNRFREPVPPPGRSMRRPRARGARPRWRCRPRCWRGCFWS